MRSIVVIALAILVLSACEPDYVTSDRLEPFVQERIISDARHELNSLIYEHEALMATLHERISSSEEKIAFDMTRAKRQLVGSRHNQRHDVNAMIDVHAYNAYSEIARARSRIDRFDAEVRTALVEQHRLIDELVVETVTEGQTAQIIEDAREALVNDQLEGWVNAAEQINVRAAEQLENELNKIRS